MSKKAVAKKTTTKKVATKVAAKTTTAKVAAKAEETKVAVDKVVETKAEETNKEVEKKVEAKVETKVEENAINLADYLGDSHVKVLFDEADKKTVTKYPINVVLKNYDINKRVLVVYTEDNWETTQYKCLDYVSQDENGIEIWSTTLKLSTKTKDSFKYAISYGCNGNEIWDNNNGEDYKF